jgi:hypothetical protein
MVIEIKPEIFNDINNLKDVNYLIGIFSNNRRYSYFCDLSEVENTEVYKNLIDIDKKLIQEYFDKHVSESTKMDYFIGNDLINFNLEEAKRFFAQSFIIILENRLNDSYFLEAIILNFKKRGKKIRRNIEYGWLDFGNGGGFDNIVNEITAIMKSFENLPKKNHEYLRCFVLVDSDKKYPTESQGKNRLRLFEFLTNIGVEYHELEKREMENYIPDEVIDTIENNNDFIQAYLRLTNLQKDYFDLENGFNYNLNSYPTEVQKLYESVSKNDILILRNNKISLQGNFKAEFPKLFSHAKITQENLKAKVSYQTNDQNELETILDKISKFL